MTLSPREFLNYPLFYSEAALKKTWFHHVPGAMASMVVDSALGRRFAGWVGIISELGEVRELAQRATHALTADQRDRLLIESLTWMIVVKYGRCFAQSDGRNAKLDADDVSDQLPPYHQSTHKDLLARRNEAFAHAGAQCEHDAVLHLVSPPDDGPELHFSTKITSAGGILEPDRAGFIADLCVPVIAIAQKKAERAYEALRRHVDENFADYERELRARAGTFATAEENALSILERLNAKLGKA